VPDNTFKRLRDALRERDPGHDGARRAFRAGIVIPVVALVSHLLAAHLLADGSQAPAFAVFGSISLLIVSNFPGPLATRALAFCGLAVTGAVLIAVGTLAAPYPWLAVALCFAVGAGVSLLSLLSEIFAASQRATLMAFLLPVCTIPTGPVGDRLLGWLIALLICVPAALFLFPPRYGGELRTLAARVCTALADRIEGIDATHTDAETDTDAVTSAMEALRRKFVGTAFRPIAMTAGSRALIRVVSNLQWLSSRVRPDTALLLGHIAPLSVGVLRSCATALTAPSAEHAAELNRAVAAHKLIAITHYDNDIRDILGAPDDAAAADLGRDLLTRRTMTATIGLTGRIIASATAADARPLWARLLGRQLPETGVADRVLGKRAAVRALSGYVSTRSATVLGSLRTGAALALALVATYFIPVQNAVWVLLGALSVLRSSAATTRVSAVRAVAGTAIGFALGAALITVVGVDPVVLWTLLPVVAFGSTYVLAVGSFVASQAMFTMMVLIVFNMLHPIGWKAGLIRVEDIILGAAVGLVVSVLLWPKGAAAAVRRAIDAAMDSGARYLNGAVLRVTRGASPATDAALRDLGRDALVDARTHVDTIRIYLAESNGVLDADLLDTTNRIPRLRTASDLIADIVPPPPGPYPRARKVLEDHTAALCARLDGSDPNRSAPELSDEFVTALRAEALRAETLQAESDGPDPAVAALPLVTVAANIGELELVYPAEPATAPAAPPASASASASASAQNR
jgi:uncharacterized membrane protein YccC